MSERARNKLATIEAIIAGLDCGALVIDGMGRVVSANPRFAELVGATCVEIAGRDWASFFENSKGEVGRFGESMLRRGGQESLPVLTQCGALDALCGIPNYRLAIIVDISSQKASEERQHDKLENVTRLSDTVIEQALALKHYAQQLEERVRERTADLREANLDAIFMLAIASEAKDADTGAHVLRIQRGCEQTALRLGMTAAEAEEIGYSSILHDVGKMVVPDHILQKSGKLTVEERKVIEGHTLAGERILSTKDFFRVARQIARSHHENWNGSGYPDGLKGEDIPFAARIVHVADVFDALTNARAYKPAWTTEAALAFLNDERGAMFAPEVVAAFEAFLDDGEASPA